MKCALPVLSVALALPLAGATIERDTAGVTMRSGGETVRVSVCGPSVVHVVAGPGNPRAASPEEPWLVKRCEPEPFEFAHDEKNAILSTPALRVLFNLEDGRLTFQDAAGKILQSESDREPRRYDAVEANGEKLYGVEPE